MFGTDGAGWASTSEEVGGLTAGSLSELLRGFRIRAGLTQAALATKAGLSEQAISVLERGTRQRPRIGTVQALTVALGLTAGEAEEFLAVARGKSRTVRVPTAPVSPAPAVTDALPVPWQLPPAVPDFTGRAAQIEAVQAALRDPARIRTGAVGLVAVTGMGGIGKTALAVQAAHKLTSGYPDGQLYLNLRGYGPGLPMTTEDALRQLLRSLGLDLQLIPDDVEEAAALLRSQLAGRRVLVVLDNATDVRQVTPLLPASPGSAAIITSRGSMAALPGARQIRLDALSETESVDLLSGVIGQARVAAEPVAVERLASFSGRLPLAIRLIGGRLAARPSWPIQHLVDLLRDAERRLDNLGSDETGVRASIASSVEFLSTSDRPLDREAAQALPLLSIPDGSDLLTIVAAHLLGVPLRRADAILERLVDLNLLESVAPDRYRLHDLIRAYARELAEESLTAAERDAGLDRVLRFYIAAAWACQRLTHPKSPRLSLATVQVEPLPAFADMGSALQWFDDEQRNLLDRVAQAAGTSIAGTAVFPELALAMFGTLEPRRRWVEMRELGRGVVELAERLKLPLTAAWLQHDSAIPEVENGALEAAVPHLFKALEMFRQEADLSGQARCCSSLTYVLGHLGRIDEALEFGNQSLRLSQEIGDVTLEGVAYTAVGGLYDRLGDYERADQAFAQGVALAQKYGDQRSVFKRYVNTGFSHVLVGRYGDAVDAVQRAVLLADEAHDDVGLNESHHTLALAFAGQGRFDTAEYHAREALRFSRRTKNRLREGRILLELAKINAATGDRSAATANATEAAGVLTGLSPLHETQAQELLTELTGGEPYTYALTNHSI